MKGNKKTKGKKERRKGGKKEGRKGGKEERRKEGKKQRRKEGKKDRRKEAKDAPRRHPGDSQRHPEAPDKAREAPRRHPGGTWEAPSRLPEAQRGSPDGQGGTQEAPRGPQEPPKEHPGGSQRHPEAPQEARAPKERKRAKFIVCYCRKWCDRPFRRRVAKATCTWPQPAHKSERAQRRHRGEEPPTHPEDKPPGPLQPEPVWGIILQNEESHFAKLRFSSCNMKIHIRGQGGVVGAISHVILVHLPTNS